jgi:hypothetical protein
MFEQQFASSINIPAIELRLDAWSVPTRGQMTSAAVWQMEVNDPNLNPIVTRFRMGKIDSLKRGERELCVDLFFHATM